MRAVALVALLVVAACGDEASEDVQPIAMPTLGGRPMTEYFMQHDKFMPAIDPLTVSPAQADFVRPEDEVFGVYEGGKARAYPITMLAYYHVVNDVVGGVPIAVTY